MIKIVSFTICPFVQRVTAMLEAKKIPYEIEFISLKEKPQWFLDISPNGQVPLLITENGTTLFESEALIEYIQDEYGFFDSKITNEEKALERAWSYLAAKNYLVQCGTMRSVYESTFLEKVKNLKAPFFKIEKQLSGKTKFFKSNKISGVDIAWLPLLHRALLVEQVSGYDLFEDMPKVKEWQGSLKATGLFEKSVSSDFTERFNSFYLETTYLGKLRK